MTDDKNLKIASLASLLLFALFGIAFLRSSITTISSNIFNGMMFLVFILAVAYLIKIIKAPKEKIFDTDEIKNSNIINNKNISFLNKFQHKNLGFDNVIGIDIVKDELKEIVNFLRYPKKYKKYNVRLPKGVLLVGPSGVGKTLIAKALANESKVPFFYHSGASFSEIYVGMGAKKVSELFQKAKQNAPSIVFIDEIDSIGKKRGDSGNSERDSTLNQLLTELDGFIESSGVILIGATNNIDMLDEALLRAGRFDRRVFLELPNLQDREELIKFYLKDTNHKIDIKALARETIGFTGALISTMINEALLSMIRRDDKILKYIDILEIKDKVFFGKKSNFLNKNDRKILAISKTAKAFIAKDINNSLEQFSIYHEYITDTIPIYTSSSELQQIINYYLSGAVLSKLIYEDSFTGFQNDFKIAKKLAKNYIFDFGMSKCFICKDDDVNELLNNLEKNLSEKLKTDIEKLKNLSEIMLINEKLLLTDFNKI